MGNTVFVPVTNNQMNASATYSTYTVTSAVTTGAAVANTVSRTIYNNTTGIIYVAKNLTTGATSFSTDGKSIPITSAIFNPLRLEEWTGAIYLQSTTAATNAVIVETVYLTWAST
jgi:hypothetical protein